MADYFVDATLGLDGNAGTSELVPWKTLAKVEGEVYTGPDTVSLKKGETWLEDLAFPSSGTVGNLITLGAYGAGADPIIDGADTRAECLTISSKDHIAVEGLELIDATSSCMLVEGTSTGITVTDVAASGSGNQAFQNLDSVSVTYNNISGTGCVDDGFSMHDSAVAVINTGTFTGNDDGINMIDDAVLTATGLTVTGNNGFAVGLESTATQVTATISSSTLEDGTVYAVEIKDKATLNLTGCTVGGTIVNANGAAIECRYTGTVNLTNCTISGDAERGIRTEETGTVTMTGGSVANTGGDYNVFAEDSSVITITGATVTAVAGSEGVYASQTSTVTLTNCTLNGTANVLAQVSSATLACTGCTFNPTTTVRHAYHIGAGTLTIDRCFFNDNFTASSIQASSTGTLVVTYSLILGGLGGGAYTVRVTTGTTTFNNNVMYCATANSRALYVRGTYEAKNNIITGFNIAFYTVAVFTLDCTNNCLYDNVTDFSGAGHPAGNVNGISADPLFVNAGGTTAEDYKITLASPCRDVGIDVSLTEDYFGTTVPQGTVPDMGFHEFVGFIPQVIMVI